MLKENVKITASDMPFNYTTIKLTQSRINKGLLAIPVSLLNLFPKEKCKIFITLQNGVSKEVNFTPYESSSGECRIGGLSEFYKHFNIQGNDELVLIKTDDKKFKLLSEKFFKETILQNLQELENSQNEADFDENLNKVKNIAKISKDELIQNEFVRLSKTQMQARRKIKTSTNFKNELVPTSMRLMLANLYKGKCQVSNFGFLMKNNKPYFEIHHINPNAGNHFKNLLVVSANTHAQFTYAHLWQKFDENGWLREVAFNGEKFKVFQIIDTLSKNTIKELHL